VKRFLRFFSAAQSINVSINTKSKNATVGFLIRSN
jgi:hypothetical protein